MGTPSHLGHMDRVAATMPSQAHAGAAQEAPNIGQWEGQDVPLVRPSSCTVKGGIPSSRRYLPTYLHVAISVRCCGLVSRTMVGLRCPVVPARTPVNKRQGAVDTAHTCALRAAEGRESTSHNPRVGRTGATQPTQRPSSRGGTPRPLVRARAGGIGDHGKHHPEPLKQTVTGEPVQIQGGGRLPSSGAPQLEPQG